MHRPPRRPADPAVHRGFGGGARQIRRGDAGAGAAAWVSADDGPIRLVAQRPTKLFRTDRARMSTEGSTRRFGGPGANAASRSQVRRLPDHRQLVDAGRIGALGRRHQQSGPAAVRQRRAKKPTLHRSGTAAAGTSTRSSWRWCCSRSARCSRSTRATTRSRTRGPDLTIVAVAILVVAIGWRATASHAVRSRRSGSWWRFIRTRATRSCRWCCWRTPAR